MPRLSDLDLAWPICHRADPHVDAWAVPKAGLLVALGRFINDYWLTVFPISLALSSPQMEVT